MSILNVNQIQPVGGGNTITVSANDVNFSGNISIGSSFVGTATTAILATSAQGLTGTPDITVGNIQSGVVTATTFIGDGSGLTGVTASGSGISIKDSGSTVGVAATVDFSTNLNVSPASAGIVTVTVGDTDFSIADKIVHTGDTNTAIRFPAADTFTVETWGRERLRISSGGLVGIGTNNPGTSLEVFTDDDTDINNNSGTNNTNSILRLYNKNGSDGTGVNNYTGIRFDVANGATSSAYLNYVRTGDNQGAFLFKARNAASSYPELLRITSAGRIGINQASPEAMLQVDYDEGNSEVGLRLRAYNASGSKTWQLSEVNGNAGVFTIKNATNSQDILNIDGVNQRVGVNDTTPDATLSVGGSTAFIDVGAAGGNRGKIGYSSNDLYFGTSSSSGEFIFKNNVTSTDNPASSGTERLRITSNGSIGTKGLVPTDGSFVANSTIRSQNSSSNISYIGFTGYTGNTTVGSMFSYMGGDGRNTGYLTFNTNDTERLRITSAGVIQCGTSAILKAEINNSVSGHQFISQCSDNNNGFEVYQQHGSNTTRNTFAVYANTGSGNAKNLQFAVRGDGAITKPGQPLAIIGTTQNNWSPSAGDVLPFNYNNTNRGNHYNTSNYTFTCPVAGDYMVILRLSRKGWCGDLELAKNNSQYVRLELRETGRNNSSAADWQAWCYDFIVPCAANDNLKWKAASVNTGTGGGNYLLDGYNHIYYDSVTYYLMG